MFWQMRIFILSILIPSIGLAWEVVQEETPILPMAPITQTIWKQVVQPAGKYDLVSLNRYRNLEVPTVAAIFFLPGTNMNGGISILTESHNLWLYLANRGVDVYAMDYRTHYVSHEVKEIDFMKDWTVATFVDDAATLVKQVRLLNPEQPLFISGYSRGVVYAFALAGRENFQGLIALDGGFKKPNPKGFDLASALRQFDTRADFASILSRRGFVGRTALMRSVLDDPFGPATNDRYETIGDELGDALYRAFGAGALANTKDGLSSIRVLAKQLIGYDWYFPSIQNIELLSIALHDDDPATEIDDHFGQMELPIIYFGAANMGAEYILSGIYSAAESGSRDITLHLLEGYGHADVLVANSAKEDVYHVIEEWLKDRIK